MPEFAYVARGLDGGKTSGTVSAQNRQDAVLQLSARSLFPVSVTTAKSRGMSLGGRRVRPQLMATTYGQLAALLRSGVPLLRSLNVIRDQTSHAGLKEILDDVHHRVEDGASLAEAMMHHPKAFGEMAIHMTRAGGEGGFLEDALERVAKFTEQQEDLKSRTMGAMAYPIFLGVVGTIVVVGLIVFFVPRFEPLFARLRTDGELPAPTEWLLWLSGTLGGWLGLVLLFAFIMGVALLRARLATEEGKRMRDLFKLRLPAAGTIFRDLAVARFCRVLGTLLHNGVPILRSLDISREASGNRVLSAAIGKASENISSGESLAAPLRQSGHFVGEVVEMISVAEESNTLETVLTDIADRLERRTERRLELLVRVLEPVMLLLLAGVVLMVVIALLMPVIKMSSTFGA